MAAAITVGAVGLAVFGVGAALNTPTMPDGPFGLWAPFRQGGGHRALELAASARMVGVVVLFGAWFALRNQRRHLLTLTAAVWGFTLMLLPPGAGDVYNYVEQGWLVLQGLDPSVVPSGSVAGPYADWGGSWTGTTVAYPPVGLALQAAVVWVSAGHSWLALVLMRLLCVVALAALWVLIPRLADVFGVSPHQATWAVALNPMLWVHGIAGIHLDLVAVALAAAALWILMSTTGRRSGRFVLAGTLALLAVGIKPQAALVLCFSVPLVVTVAGGWRRRQLMHAVVSGLVVAALVGIVALGSRLSPFGAHWTGATGDPSWASSSMWSIFADVAGRVGGPLEGVHGQLAPHAMLWCSLAAVAVLLVVALTVELPDAPMFAALTLLVVCIIGPAGRPWYLLPAVLALGLVRWTSVRQAVVTTVVLVALSGEMFVTMSYLGRQAWSWGLATAMVVTIWIVRVSVDGPPQARSRSLRDELLDEQNKGAPRG
ncbi:hypothetical protein ACPCG0_10465 [Propionibacteriaceae bacterium Y1923]|uniref:hypothetical protein n=1 Tax=Aestuariimicrobium sp. Y1814 TaxID=3418742 RepID=UPI003C1BBFCE